MTMRGFLLIPAVLAVLLLSACQPMGPMPGGELSGAVAPAPADWTAADAAEIVQLETRPDSPYSVNIWGVGIGPAYYIAAGAGETTWTANIAADPNVRLKVGEVIHELRAVKVTDAAELDIVRAAYVRKYEMSDDQREQSGSATVFRLEAR
jgi:hypothetical protein